MTSIWCLFSVENNYDQPDNNLVRWWSSKPSIEELARFMGMPLDKTSDEGVVRIVNLWQGQQLTVHGDTRYRLQEVKEGESP